MANFVLELKNISKTFPGVKALSDVHYELKPGEIHALMGENGAGKSTFIKIITGVYSPDSGEILVDGKKVTITTPPDAQALGIAAIYQHVTCFPDLSVAENIFMGHEQTASAVKRVDWKTMNRKAQELLDQLDASFDARTIMGSLSVARQQIVEIAKALSVNARIIIMDEPTAALSARECEDLYRITKGLKAKGNSVIFISHRFEDMYKLADRVTVFRDGNYVNTWNVSEVDDHKMVVAMVGREINQFFPKRNTVPGEEIFRVEGLSRTGFFRDVNFTVRKGEILALTGLVGAGRTEVCEAIFGISPYDSGTITLDGQPLYHPRPSEALDKGIGYLPEDRLKQGLIMRWEIAKNITLPALERFLNYYLINRKQENETARDLSEKLGVKAQTVHDKVSTLSGGNQQKVIVAKLLTSDMKIIILDEPTKGVDVGAKTAIYSIMNDLVNAGYGIVMVSSEMPEVLGMSDRIVVMRDGKVSAAFETKGTTQEQILRAAIRE
ncbi:MAG: sugar ABC transporter ATP-binding protein [Treponema sp.]|nr:sugar ABC transporter ATP-binding protein [Treponema sp.]